MTMTRAAIALALGLSGCVSTEFIPISTPGTGPVAVTTVSRAAELKRGMTMADVSRIAGAPAGSYDDPGRIGHVCFSHVYGSPSAPLYIHAEFLGGNLVAATDGYAAPCGPSNFP